MALQVIQDGKGRPAGVFIPIDQWKMLKKQYRDLEELEYEAPTKEQILQELKEAAEEVRLHKQGKLKLKTAQELLSEL